MTSKARNLANLLADGAIGSSELAEGAAVANIANGSLTASKFANNAVSTATYRSTGKVTKFVYYNDGAPQQPIGTTITLSEAEAPIGSFVIMSSEVYSGSSAGDQYCYLYQRGASTSNAVQYSWVEGWYWYTGSPTLFYINDAADRTFYVVHGTITQSTTGDYRLIAYHGYLKVTQ